MEAGAKPSNQPQTPSHHVQQIHNGSPINTGDWDRVPYGTPDWFSVFRATPRAEQINKYKIQHLPLFMERNHVGN